MLFYSLPGHLIFAPLTNKSLIMKKKVVVDHKTGITPTNYAAMEQKLRQAAREAVFAREQMLKDLILLLLLLLFRAMAAGRGRVLFSMSLGAPHRIFSGHQ